MSYYRMNELDVVVPDGWLDGTINVFLQGPKNDKASATAALTVIRDHLHPTTELNEYIDLSLIEGAKRFPGYQLVHRRTIDVDADSAVEIIYTWVDPERETMRNFQAILRMDTVFVSLTLVTTSECNEDIPSIWESILKSIRRRDV